MNRARIAAFGAAMMLAAGAVPVDAQPLTRLTFVRDTAFPLDKHLAVRRMNASALVGRDGRVVVVPFGNFGDVVAMDSNGMRLPWTMPVGRNSPEIATVTDWGWSGDSLWVNDRIFEQLVLVGAAGKVTTSIGYPNWIRPFWRDRRKYPLFETATWYGVYGDGTALAQPTMVRRLLDTPGYDPDSRLLVRVDRDGRILRTVATIPLMDGRLLLRSGTERKQINIPNYPRAHWRVSSDAERVVVILPIGSDSGAFRVTALDAQGDTVFSRRYAVDAIRVPRAGIETFLGTLAAFGRFTADQVRDTVTKLVPAYNSPVQGLHIGVDHTVWVQVRRPTTPAEQSEWLVIDPTGELLGSAMLPRVFKMTAASATRLWSLENDRTKQVSTLVRYLRSDVRPVRPSRSATASGSSAPARRPE